MKIYSDKKKSTKTIIRALIIAIGALLILGLINLITVNLFHHYFIPHILLVPALFLFVYLYRAIVQTFLPVIIIEDLYFKYFNVLWYSKYHWDKINSASITKEQLLLFASSGKMTEKIGFDEFSDADKENLLYILKERKILK